MTRAATTFIFAVLVTLAALFVAGGDACNNVATMSWEDACFKACGNTKERWLQLCKQTLQGGPDTAEVTVYTLIATRLARLKYEDAMADMDQMLAAGNLTVTLKAAIELCKRKYGEGRALMRSVADQLFACDLSQVRQEYIDAQVSVGVCDDSLWDYHGLPLYAKVVEANDLTTVSYLLGALIVGK